MLTRCNLVARFIQWYVLGTSLALLGMFFLAAKPYRKNWMNCIDGLVTISAGVTLLISIHSSTAMIIAGLVIALIMASLISLYKCVCRLKPK